MKEVEGRPSWAEISHAALKANFQTIKRRLSPGVQLMAVVKANAYGHGAVECARTLEAAGADWFGVALIEEGAELRNAGIKIPVFGLGGFWRGQASRVVANEITPAIYQLAMAEELNAAAEEAGRVVDYHLKVDTGMGRLGVPVSELAQFARELKRFDRIKLDGLMTHFADADGVEPAYTESQILRFEEASKMIDEIGFAPFYRQLANSAGIFGYSGSHGNLARAGATLYGLTEDVVAPRLLPLDLIPVMSLRSRIIHLKNVDAGASLGYGRAYKTARECRIATIPIGYADGLRRAHSNKGRVIVRNGFAPIVGRVSMDLTIIDVTDIEEAALGDEVTLLGEQGGLRIFAEEMAQQAQTISYEIVTGISARIPRIHV